ncbi:hypothetical protein PRZ48_008894 [Zasmidium cellare]|uniref:F-box domain-containing protein n=1 Tax=Zasmidium cellare TaxID=395010 RepID=A0ABR0EGU3_ZASCE|nr:hypothetical protein PRZ48_008894 [Zasmidium cellare]
MSSSQHATDGNDSSTSDQPIHERLHTLRSFEGIFAAEELLEMILSNLDPAQLVSMRRVSKRFRDILEGSILLKKKAFFIPDETAPGKVGHHKLNPVLFHEVADATELEITVGRLTLDPCLPRAGGDLRGLMLLTQKPTEEVTVFWEFYRHHEATQTRKARTEYATDKLLLSAAGGVRLAHVEGATETLVERRGQEWTLDVHRIDVYIED